MKKGVRYPVEILERREVDALLAGCGTSPTGRRDRAPQLNATRRATTRNTWPCVNCY
jgi:hypothetical protein